LKHQKKLLKQLQKIQTPKLTTKETVKTTTEKPKTSISNNLNIEKSKGTSSSSSSDDSDEEEDKKKKPKIELNKKLLETPKEVKTQKSIENKKKD